MLTQLLDAQRSRDLTGTLQLRKSFRATAKLPDRAGHAFLETGVRALALAAAGVWVTAIGPIAHAVEDDDQIETWMIGQVRSRVVIAR